jgi:hypothetical protein
MLDKIVFKILFENFIQKFSNYGISLDPTYKKQVGFGLTLSKTGGRLTEIQLIEIVIFQLIETLLIS